MTPDAIKRCCYCNEAMSNQFDPPPYCAECEKVIPEFQMTIEQHARMEAEERYPTYIPGYNPTDDRVEAYAAALIAERSKPQPSVDEVMAIVGPLCLGEATERHITERLTKLFNK